METMLTDGRSTGAVLVILKVGMQYAGSKGGCQPYAMGLFLSFQRPWRSSSVINVEEFDIGESLGSYIDELRRRTSTN